VWGFSTCGTLNYVRTSADTTLLDLLGDTRAQVAELLRAGPLTVADLSRALGLSEVAADRHLQVLERDGLVSAETVRRDGPGRPRQQYTLTDRARRLFPDRSADLANELLDYLEAEHGRQALLGFLRWRAQRHGTRYAGELDTAAGTGSRAELLARLLSDEGFAAHVSEVTTPEGATVLELRQEHCAIKDVAEEHPEVCSFEAAVFQKVLGAGVTRKQTIAGGAGACVCHITPPENRDR
jgi:predicted ArsR family transcriptional regulator